MRNETSSKRSPLFYLIIVMGLGVSLWLLSLDARANKDFKPYIAECRNIDDVNIIVEGRLLKKDIRLNEMARSVANVDSSYWGASQAKPIYMFVARFAYKGINPIPRSRYGGTFAYIIREGEAPPDALGKEALLCLGGFRPRTIKAIYIED